VYEGVDFPIYDDNEPGPSQHYQETLVRDTQATVVPSSPPRLNPERPRRGARRGVSRDPAPQPSVSHNTRSHHLPENQLHQLGTSKPPLDIKRPRGRSKGTQRPKGPQPPRVRRDEQPTVSPVVNVSVREEVQVEEILRVAKHPQEKDRDGGSSADASSSESDEAARKFLNASKEMITRGASRRPQPRSTSAVPDDQRKITDIVIPSESTIRQTTNLQLSPVNPRHGDTGTDATSRVTAVTVTKAAKKTAARVPVSESHDSDFDDVQTTGTTGSSIPAEMTMAHDYKTAQKAFTPAPGTIAEKHVRSERSKGRTGSRRTA
jgi:hypothetical protein